MAIKGQSVVVTYAAWDTSANNYKTGDVANHSLSIIKDGGARAACANSPAEVDATNMPGIYKITLTNTEMTANVIRVAGKSSTANIVILGLADIFTDQGVLPGGTTAGGAGGLFINGTNTGPVTINGGAAAGATPASAALTLNGGAASTTGGGVAAPGLAVLGGAGAASTNGAASGVTLTGGGTNTVGSNADGITLAGASTGAGLRSTGGATGQGILVNGGATSGDGIKVITVSGHGINLAPVGANVHGILATGGNSGTCDGVKAAAGTGGVGMRADSLTVTGGTTLTGAVSLGSTLQVSGTTTLAVVNTGNVTFSALTVTNATTFSGAVLLSTTLTVTGATAFTGNVAMAAGLNITQTTGNGSALVVTGNGTGHGAIFTSGSGVTGDGVKAVAASTNGNGMELVHSGSGSDLLAVLTTTNLAATWDVAIASHLNAGSTGLALNSAGSAGDPWATAIPGAYGAGTAGHRLGQLPDVVAGAAGGVFIAGTNAPVTITGSGPALTITSTGANGSAVVITGQGTGHGILALSGTGASGDGIHGESQATNGNGMGLLGGGSGDGMHAQGGAAVSGAANSRGIHALGGANNSAAAGLICESVGGGNGLTAVATGTGIGFAVTGSGNADGMRITAGGSGGSGLNLISAAGNGIQAGGLIGLALAANGGSNGNGFQTTGDGTGDGIAATGGATGRGMHLKGGGTSGAALRAEAQAGNANGVEFVHQGSGLDLSAPGQIPAALSVGLNMKSDIEEIAGNTGGAARLDRSAPAIVIGTVGSASSPTSIITSSLSPAATVTDQFKGRVVIFDKDTTTTNLRGVSAIINGMTSGGVIDVTGSTLPASPVSGDTFTVT